jgi:threonine dehydratase
MPTRTERGNMTTQPTLADIKLAEKRIRKHLPIPPVTTATTLSDKLGIELLCKWDNKFRTGSFKERGALNFLLSMDTQQQKNGVIAASAGNHALGVSYHAQRLGIPCHLIMPTNAPLVKVESCRKFGASITLHGTLSDSINLAKERSSKENTTYIPPFDHFNTVCGQGVAGLELLDQIPDFDAVVIPVGGGGYAAGISTAIKAVRPEVYILGVCSEWALGARNKSPEHAASIPPSTIADGIAVKTIGAVTGPILDRHLSSLVAVSERSIAKAIITLLEYEHVVVEGAGAAGLAAILDGYLPSHIKKPVVMVCGSNIDMNLLSRLIEHDMAERGRLLRINVSLPDRPGMLNTISGIIAQEGANVLQVSHDRFYAQIPGHVDITVVMEVRDRAHGASIIKSLQAAGLPTIQS